MFSERELKITLDYYRNSEAYYSEIKRSNLPADLEILYCIVLDAEEKVHSNLPLDRMKTALEFSFKKVLSTHGIIPTWLQVSHILLVERLKKELNG